MAEQAIFKSQTFGGFNKEEVLKYIDKLNSEYTEEHDKAEEDISSLKTELDGKCAELSEANGKYDDLKSKYDEIMEAYEELRQHYLMLKEHDDNISAENEKLSARLDTTEKELAIEKEVHFRLEAKLEEERQKLLEHAEKERKLAVSVESAGDSAKMMLAFAKNGAQSMVSDAQSTADEINTEIDEFKTELEKTRDFMQDSLSVLVQRLEYIGKNAENAKIPSEERTSKAAEIQKKYEELVLETEMKTSAIKERFFR